MADITVTKIPIEMIDSVARLHMTAFKGYPNTLIGMSYTRAFFRWFCEADEAIALCAVDNVRNPVGYVVGAPLGYTKDLNKFVLWPSFTGILLRPWLVFNTRLRQIVVDRLRSLIKHEKSGIDHLPILPSPTISLVGIGVHPEARGKGVGQKLLLTFEYFAIEAMAKSMRLSVYPNNLDACRLYTKVGWKSLGNPNGPLIYYYKIIG